MKALEMNRKDLEQYLEEGKAVLVEYWAPWCGYCRRIAPAMDLVAAQYGEQITVGKINIDEEPELARKEQIDVIPTLVLYIKGKAAGSVTAPDSKAAIETFIQSTLEE